MNETNVILSRWPLTHAKRYQLELRSDQFFVERYLYERCCMVEARVEIPGFQDLYIVNTHTSAFAQDQTRTKHLISFRKRLETIDQQGFVVVGGGDLNSVPPGSDSTDFCEEHKCAGEIVHQAGVEPFHKEGMFYEPETDGIKDLYDGFNNVIPLADYLLDQPIFFTQNPVPEMTWDRTLDYMFTNHRWKTGSGIVHQECTVESDHAPVCGELILRKN
jgi:endonuclease/exonuclease/phosphatase family metal-dependent hydrolase